MENAPTTPTSSVQTQIMDVAQRMLQQGGYQAFSYRDISAEVGIKTASIHYYFPSKGDLALAIAQRINAGLQMGLAQLESLQGDPLAGFRQFCGMFSNTLGRADRLCPICMLAVGQDTLPPAVRAEVQQFWQRAETWLQRVIERGQDLKVFQAHGAAAPLAKTILAGLEGAMITARAFSDPSRLTHAIATYEKLICAPRR